MTNPTVYFADRTLRFLAAAPAEADCAGVGAREGISRDQIPKILESHNSVAVVAADPGAAFAAFAAEFTRVEAAGGVVVDDAGAWLMMRRNGRWDLPKGHVEAGEDFESCAAREIAEETGVAARVVRPLCETLHAYWFPKTARWELKRTHWFELRTTATSALRPQTEEGIEQVVWCTPDEAAEHVREAFPTIRCVARAMRE